MPALASGAALTTAFTDLAAAVIIVPAALLIKRKNGEEKLEKLWLRFFILLGAASFVGFAAHAWMWSSPVYRGIWTGLYGLLYAVVCAFLAVPMYMLFSDAGSSRGMRWVWLTAFAVYITTLILLFLDVNPIRLMVAFAFAAVLPGFGMFAYLAVKRGSAAARIALCTLIPQLFGGVFQIVRKGSFTLIWTFDYNSIYHLCLIASILFFCAAAVKSLERR